MLPLFGLVSRVATPFASKTEMAGMPYRVQAISPLGSYVSTAGISSRASKSKCGPSDVYGCRCSPIRLHRCRPRSAIDLSDVADVASVNVLGFLFRCERQNHLQLPSGTAQLDGLLNRSSLTF